MRLVIRSSLRLALAVLALQAAAAQAQARANYFDDPFLQATNGIPNCPVPEGPLITEAEMRAQSHVRAERGTRCFLSGVCRLPNSYLYDKEIVPRVKKAILASKYFAETSVWVEGQRRWVWLKGCVRSEAAAAALGEVARRVEEVETVINELVVTR